MALPNFMVSAASPVTLDLAFEGFALYSILLSDWNGTKWVPRVPAVADHVSSHGGAPTSYGLGSVAAGTTILVTIPVALTSPSGDTSVSMTVSIKQGTTLVGTVATPPATPGPDEQASTVVRFFLTGN